MSDSANILEELRSRFGEVAVAPQATRDGLPTAWIPQAKIRASSAT